MDTPRKLKGICNFYFDQGYDGCEAFQDSQFVAKDVPHGYCKKCGMWMTGTIGRNGGTHALSIYTLDDSHVSTQNPDCPEGAHEEEIRDVWQMAGFHVLKNGDKLEVYSRNNPEELVWSGIVDFANDCDGHRYQKGLDKRLWARWFFNEYPATLILAEQPNGAGL